MDSNLTAIEANKRQEHRVWCCLLSLTAQFRGEFYVMDLVEAWKGDSAWIDKRSAYQTCHRFVRKLEERGALVGRVRPKPDRTGFRRYFETTPEFYILKEESRAITKELNNKLRELAGAK